jgi:hypothetical protein
LRNEIAARASDAVRGILRPVPRKPRRREGQNVPELIELTWFAELARPLLDRAR